MTRRFSAEEKALVVKGKLEGKTHEQIGKQIGRSKVGINRLMHTNKKLREIIETEAARIISKGLKPSGDLILKFIGDGDKSTDKDERRLAFDAAKHVTNIAGISGGAPGTVVNTMIQVNQAPQMVAELGNIRDFLSQQWGVKKEPVIDAEVEDEHSQE
jgi:hypothetical protein